MSPFQIGHLFIQGPNTTDLMITVDTCETINESMIQLVFQLVIIMASDQSKPISKLQIMVVIWSLLMASKGPAEDFLATTMKRLMKEKEGVSKGVKYVDKDGLKKTLDEDGYKNHQGNMTEDVSQGGSTTFCCWIPTKDDSYKKEDQDGTNTGSAEIRYAPEQKFEEEKNVKAQQYVSGCFCKQIKVRKYHEMDFFGEKLLMIGRAM